MTERLAAAEAALREGRREDALAEFGRLFVENPAQSEASYLTFTRQLYHAGRFEEGDGWALRGLEQHRRSHDLWNIHGVFLRKLGRPAEALKALGMAIGLKPDLSSAQINRGNVLLDLGDASGAVAAFSALAASGPDDPVHLNYLAGALVKAGRPDEAAPCLQQALALKPDYAEVSLQLADLLNRAHRPADAEAVLDQALAMAPDSQPLVEAKAALLRESGQPARAESHLLELAARFPDEAWIPFHLGDLVWESDHPRGEVLLRKAVELAPANLDYLVGFIQSLERNFDPGEGARLDEAHALALQALEMGASKPGHTKVLRDVFARACAFDGQERLGDFRTLGRSWAGSGRHAALFTQLARVQNHEDRLELLEQHRLWGDAVETEAARAPIRRSARTRGDRIRLGVVSSDLRNHVVGYFARPIFNHVDRERFEVYGYSFSRAQAGEVQAHIAGQVAAFRWQPFISARDAAQMIADDGLDMLIELGGSTNMNKLEVMGYKPAPLQASWLGYPHSAGLSTIDYFLCDQHNKPTSPDLMLEQPLLLPDSWVSLGFLFDRRHEIRLQSAQERNGFITFGSFNHPQKYSRAVLRAWARVLALTPGARFAFVRPEGASSAFRSHVLAEFAAGGVGADRVLFQPVRGQHMDVYNELDISLDTFPLTGGTTTAESLWMGVPVVSLVGEAFYERLSYSILSNAGLADLCAFDLEGYVAAATRLAADHALRRDLRGSLRDRLRDSALGRPEAFARNFYEVVGAAVASR